MEEKSYPSNYIHDHFNIIKKLWDKFNEERTDDVSYEKKVEQLLPFFKQVSFQNSLLVLLWDVVRFRFIIAIDEKKVVGHSMASYLNENGMEFSISNFHPDYISSVLLMQEKGFEYFSSQKEQQKKLFANYDGLYKKSNGEYFHFLQQTTSIETDSEGNTLLFLLYIRDISYFKKERSSNFIITGPTEIKIWNYNFNTSCLEHVQSISPQEKIILKQLAQGKNSKQMAEELFLSSHTIDTHRRNLLKKTNCVDTSGLVTYARLVGLL